MKNPYPKAIAINRMAKSIRLIPDLNKSVLAHANSKPNIRLVRCIAPHEIKADPVPRWRRNWFSISDYMFPQEADVIRAIYGPHAIAEKLKANETYSMQIRHMYPWFQDFDAISSDLCTAIEIDYMYKAGGPRSEHTMKLTRRLWFRHEEDAITFRLNHLERMNTEQ